MTSVNDGSTKPMTSEPPRDPFSPGQIRALKIAIAVMTVILIAGIFAIIGRIVYLANQPVADAGRAAPPTAQSSAAAMAALALPRDAQISSMALGGNRLAVHYKAPGGDGIIVLDASTGKRLLNIAVTKEAATPRQ